MRAIRVVARLVGLSLLVLFGLLASEAAEQCANRGSSMGKEFKDVTRFAPVSYKKDWEAVVGIEEANGVAYTKESPDYKLSKPPSAGE
jgi:hypothetical protein